MSPSPDPMEDANPPPGGPPNIAAMAAAAAMKRNKQRPRPPPTSPGDDAPMSPASRRRLEAYRMATADLDAPLGEISSVGLTSADGDGDDGGDAGGPMGGTNIAAMAAAAAKKREKRKAPNKSKDEKGEVGLGGQRGSGNPTTPGAPASTSDSAKTGGKTSPFPKTSPVPKTSPLPTPKKNYDAYFRALESTQILESGGSTKPLVGADMGEGGYSLTKDSLLSSIEPLPFDERADIAVARGESVDVMDTGGDARLITPSPERTPLLPDTDEEFKSTSQAGSGEAGGEMTIAAMAAAAAKKKKEEKEKESAAPPPNPMGGMNIAAMAAAAAKKKAEKKESQPPPNPMGGMNIAALAAAAAQKKNREKAVGSPNPVKWTSGTIIKTERVGTIPPPPLGEGDDAPVNIAAMAAAAAQKKNKAKASPPPSGGGPMNIAAMAAAAAQKKNKAKVSPEEGTGGGPMNIAAAAAAAARKKEQAKGEASSDSAEPPKQPQSPPSGGPMNIAAAAAAAARKKEERYESNNMNIAAAAAAAARQKEPESSPSPAPPGLPPGGIAAAAAAAARKKEQNSSAKASPPPPGLPPGGIAAAAAAAARKKEQKGQTSADGGGSSSSAPRPPPPLPPGGIAAAAAAAARKKEQKGQSSSGEEAPKSPISPPSGGPMNIAAAAAAAARKKEQKGQSSSKPPSTPPPLPPGGIAAAAAAAANQRSLEKPSSVQTPGSPVGDMPLTPGSPRHQGSSASASNSSQKSFDFNDTDVQRKEAAQRREAQRARARRMQIARQKNLRGLQSRQQRRKVHGEFAASSDDAVARLMERQMDQSSPPPGMNKSYDQQQSERSSRSTVSFSSNADDFMDVDIGTDADEYVGWKNRVRSDLESLSSGDDASVNGSLSDAGFNRETCEAHGRANCPGCNRSRIHRRKNQEESSARRDNTSILLNSLRSSAATSKRRSTNRKLVYQDDPEADIVHAKAAEALIRVIEMKELNFDHVLARLERYKRETRRRRWNKETQGIETLYAPIDMDDYVNEDEDDNIDSQSCHSELSTTSANHRQIARNTVKLASHIMHAPEQKFKSKKNVPLKNDPEYGLYFRMLRYGFTIGAVRAALQRDGKPDITRLDPDKPVHQQKLPKVAHHDLDHELRLGHESAPSSVTESHAAPLALERGQSIEIQGMEFDEEGLTDRGWESALESARKSFDRSDSQRGSSSKTPKYRMSPLIPGSMTPAFLRDRLKSEGSVGSNSESQVSSLPPWLQSNTERGIVEGWLRKRTRRGRWVRRWYLLDSTGIYYSHSPPTSREARMKLGSHDSKFTKLIDARTVGAKSLRQNPNEFEVWHPSHDKAVASLRAQSVMDAKSWVDAINSASERLRLVDEVVVGQLVPENLVQNTVEMIQAREEAIQESYRTPSPTNRGRYSGGGQLETIVQGEAMDGEGYEGMGGEGLGGDYDEFGAGGEGGYGGYLDGEGGDGYGGLGGDGEGGFGGGYGVGFGGGYGEDFGELGDGEIPFDKFKRLLTEGTAFSTLNLSGAPKRPKLQRQCSWPPLSLMSDGTLATRDGKSKEEIEADLKSVEDELQRVKSGGGSGDGSGTGDAKDGEKKDGEAKDGEKKGDDSSNDTDGEPKLKNDPKYIKYFNMMKVGLPKDVAKHAMTRDELDPSILDLDPEKSLKSQLEPKESSSDDGPPLKEDPKYIKYFNMMKVGLPKDVAKHAMTRDELDPSILDLDPDKSLKSQTKSESADDGPPLKDDPKYVKYFKMMKMGLPKEAAKHAMVRDQMDPSVLDLDPEKSLKSQTKSESEDDGPPLKDDPKYVKYFKMMKMGLPKEAAKHAMVRDQLDPNILDMDPEKSLKSQTEGEAEDDGPPLKDDPKYVKYFKMMKMGLPKDAAQHAMVRDGLDPKILDLDPEKSLKSQEEAGPPLKDDPKYAKYFKMLKMGLPMGAVKNALTRDGLDPAIMDLDHDKPFSSQIGGKGKGGLKAKPKKPKIRRKKVYWNKIEAKEGNVWDAVKKLEAQLQQEIDEVLDIKEFERLFSQAIDAAKEQEKKDAKENASKSQKSVKVIDSKRGMNGDIILKKIKMNAEQVATMVDNMDSSRLDAVELKSLYEFMPNDEESKGLTAYLESQNSRDEAVAEMTPCEQYMVAMKDLVDSEKKFQSIIFLAEFQNKMSELKWDVDHLVAACEELKTSKRFQTLLAMILILVNKINTGEEGGPTASGFTLDSLVKLSETKAFDNKTSVLHYLVRVARQTKKDVLKFQADIKSVVLAKGVIMERLLTNAKALCEDSRIVSETAAKDGDEYRESLKNPPTPKYKFRDVKAQRASVKELRQMVTFLPEKDVPIGKMDTTHFERFALFSKLELQKALGAIKEANQNYLGILEYFGEDMKTQATDFFGMIDQFMEAFDQAVDLVEKEEEAKLKEARRKLAKEAKLKVKSAFKSAAEADEVANALKGSDNGDGEPKKKKKSWKDRPVLQPSADLEPVKAKDYNKKPEDDEEQDNSGGHMNIAALAAAAAKKKKPLDESDSDTDSSSESEAPVGGIAAIAAAAARKKKKPRQPLAEDAPKPADDEAESPESQNVEAELMSFLSKKHPSKPPAEIAAMAVAAARESSPPSDSAAQAQPMTVDPATQNVEAELMSFLSKKHPSKPPAEIAAMAVAAARESSPPDLSSQAQPMTVDPASQNVEAELMSFLSKKHPSKPPAEIAAMAVAAARESSQSDSASQAQPMTVDPATQNVEAELMSFLSKKHPSKPPAEIAAMAVAAARESSPPSDSASQAQPMTVDPESQNVEAELMSFLSKKHPSKPPAEIAAMAVAAARESSQPSDRAPQDRPIVADPESQNVEAELMSFLSKKHPSKPPAEIAAMAVAAARESSQPSESTPARAEEQLSQLGPRAASAAGETDQTQSETVKEVSSSSKRAKSGRPKIIEAVAAAAARRKEKQNKSSAKKSSQPPQPLLPSGPEVSAMAAAARQEDGRNHPSLEDPYQQSPPSPSGGSLNIAASAAEAARHKDEQSQPAIEDSSQSTQPTPSEGQINIAAMAAAAARHKEEQDQETAAMTSQPAMEAASTHREEELSQPDVEVEDTSSSTPPSYGGQMNVAAMAAAAARQREELIQPAVDDQPQPSLMAPLRSVERPVNIAESAAVAAQQKQEQNQPTIDESSPPHTFAQLRRVEREPLPTPARSVGLDNVSATEQSGPLIDESPQPRTFAQLRHVAREPSPPPPGSMDVDEGATAAQSGPSIDESPQPRIFAQLRHVETDPLRSSGRSTDVDGSAAAEQNGPSIDESSQPRIFAQLRHVETEPLRSSGRSMDVDGSAVAEESGASIDESSQPRIFAQLRQVERPKQPPSDKHMNIAAMAAAAARQKEEQNEPSIEEQVQSSFLARLRPVERRAPPPAKSTTAATVVSSLKQAPSEPEVEKEDRLPTRPPMGLMNIAAAAAAAAREKEERHREEEARRLAEENAKRERILAERAERRRKQEEARQEAEENARRQQALAEQRQKEEEAQMKAGITNIAAMAALAAQRRSEAKEQQHKVDEEKRRLAREESKREAERRAEQLKQEQYEREREQFERKEKARRERAEQLRREIEMEDKERLKHKHHEDHLRQEKLVAEKYEAEKKHAAEEMARKEKLRLEREEKERRLREARAKKEAARQKKEEERKRKLEERLKKEEERQKREQEMRERYEREKKEIEEQARMELEQERLEREQAKRERLEQQRKALEEQQKAQRAERLRRIKAEQERVEMQMKRATEHGGPGRQLPRVAAHSDREEAVRRSKIEHERRMREQAHRAHLAEQRQKEEARRLVAEAERLKKRLANEKARASVKPRSTSTPRGGPASENVEAELMSWLSKKHPSKPSGGKAKTPAQSSASRPPPSAQRPPSQSRLSAAVSQAAKGRPQSQSKLSAAVSQAAQQTKKNPSRLSMAVAAKASSQRKPNAAPSSAPAASTPAKRKSEKPVADDTELELLNWVQHNRARPAEI